MQTEIKRGLRWMRMVGDTIFAIGAIAFVYFAIDLMWQRPDKELEAAPSLKKAA